MKRLIFTPLLLLSLISNAQDVVDWDGVYQLQLSDFQAPTTYIDPVNTIYSLQTGTTFGFGFYMSNAEFAVTKNFNSNVMCSFSRSISSIIAPDSTIALQMLAFARYEFDLAELYARKLRKRIYEEKKFTSKADFYQPIYNDVQKEFLEHRTIAIDKTKIGTNAELLAQLHQEVLKEIELLSDFCKTCRPPKKKT